MGVEIVGSIDELLTKVDAVLLESVDGRPHLEQVRPVLKAHKPVFIDKPMAGSVADAIEIFRLAKELGTPCFSSSSLRFGPDISSIRTKSDVGDVLGCTVYSPCSLEEHHPDLFWYGIHGVEMLYTVMGPGCVSVTRTHTAGADVVTGLWSDGRIGTFRGLRDGKTGYGGVVFGSKGIRPLEIRSNYEPMLVEIVKFFKSGKSPINPDETIELLAFMEAADVSKTQHGAPVKLSEVMQKKAGASATSGGK
jgi:predicted dehydrogenase